MDQTTTRSDFPLPLTRATIAISNLRLRTFIGFNPEETSKKQDVVINATIEYRIDGHVLEDRVDGALNYKTVTKRIIRHVEEGRFLLLEKLTADVLQICSDHPDVIRSRVSVDKPHALRFADSVSLTLEYAPDSNVRLHSLEKAS